MTQQGSWNIFRLCCYVAKALMPLAILSVVNAATEPSSPLTRARFLLSADVAAPGDLVWAAIELRMPQSVHVYWRNPGDLGAATEVRWNVPPGIAPGPLQWPAPEKLSDPPFTTYIFSNKVFLLAPFQVDREIDSGNKIIEASVSWMECSKRICQAGKTNLSTHLKIDSTPQASTNLAIIDVWRRRIPQPILLHSGVIGYWQANAIAGLRTLVLMPAENLGGQLIDFFPYSNRQYYVRGDTAEVHVNGRTPALHKTVRLTGSSDWPQNIAGLAILSGKGPSRGKAIEVEINITQDLEASP